MSHKKSLVVVLHGMGNSPYLMSALSWYLRRQNFSVLNIGYPSGRAPAKELATLVKTKIFVHWEKGEYDKIHFVGFSLGSQIAKAIIHENHHLLPFSRLVMIGPPNSDASIAKFLKKHLPMHRLFGPVYDELCSNQFPNPSSLVEVGIIAGGIGNGFGINPFLGKDNDGLVTVEETLLEGSKAHKVIFALHAVMPLSPTVMKMTANFLKGGSF